MATANGTIAKCSAGKIFQDRATSGLKAITFREDDHLVGVALTGGDDDLLLLSDNGKAACASTRRKVRTTARGAIGVRGIKLSDAGHKVIALIVAQQTGAGDASRWRTRRRR